MAKILDPIHPEEILREEFLAPLGIGIDRPAREIVGPPGRIGETVNAKRDITAETALRVFSAFPRKCGSGSWPSTTRAWRAVLPARKSNGVFILTPRLESLPPTVVRQRPLRHPLQRRRHSCGNGEPDTTGCPLETGFRRYDEDGRPVAVTKRATRDVNTVGVLLQRHYCLPRKLTPMLGVEGEPATDFCLGKAAAGMP